MTQYQIILLVFACINILGVWILFPLKKDVETLKKELSEHKLHVAEKYVTDDNLKDHLSRIEKSLDEIKDFVTKK